MATALTKQDAYPNHPWFQLIEVTQTNESIDVCMEIPGIELKDLNIRVRGAALTIAGERKVWRKEQGMTWHRVEFHAGTFSRTVTLPCPVREEAVDAQYRDGVLRFTLPKTEEAKSLSENRRGLAHFGMP